jgi:radical SAM superfamily enzyme YgiQ (UPF0313 family)
MDFSRLVLAEKLNITWQLASGTRSEAIDEEVIPLLRDSGCRLVIYAPESGSIEELKRIKKQIKPERMLQSMRAAHAAGMETKANMIFGMLGATWKDVLHSFIFIFRMALAGLDNVTAYPYSPYPGSEDFSAILASGRVQLNDDYFRGLMSLCRNLHTTSVMSYNERFSGRMLAAICSCAFVFFYSLNYLLRPWRLAKLVYTNFVKREASSLLTVAFSNVRRKKAVRTLIENNSAETVLVPNHHRLQNKTS